MSASANQLEPLTTFDLIHGILIPLVGKGLREGFLTKSQLEQIHIHGSVLARVLAAEGEREMVFSLRRLLYHLQPEEYWPGSLEEEIQHLFNREMLWPIWGDLQPRLEAFTDFLACRITPECESAEGMEGNKRETASGGTSIETVLPSVTYPTLLAAADLAKRLNQPRSRVESFLRRYRQKHPDCFTEVEDGRMNEPRYLYRVEEVEPILRQRRRTD